MEENGYNDALSKLEGTKGAKLFEIVKIELFTNLCIS